MWQPRFAYGTAAVILVAFALVSLPLWLVFYRISGSTATDNGGGPKVADLVGLSMLLMGGLLTAAAAWVIIVEMRGRVRMVDRLARTSERETLLVQVEPQLVPFEPPVAADENTEVITLPSAGAETDGTADAEQDTVRTPAPPAEPTVTTLPAAPPPAVVADQAPPSAAATLEASSKLLQSFSRVLRAFSQLPAQVAMLAVALSLFVGATLLSLRP